MTNRNKFIINPYTQTPEFGKSHEITVSGHTFHEGVIYLKHGRKHKFGLDHIWQEHGRELKKFDYTTRDCMARFVADILQKGAGIYSEFDNLKGNHRVTVIKSSIGLVIAQPYYDGINGKYYSVVTAYKKEGAHGTRIGTMS